MRIQTYKPNIIKPINFTSTKRTVYKTQDNKIVTKSFYDKDKIFLGCENEEAKILVSNSTNFFRSDILWSSFAERLEQLFENDEKINVYDFGCSDGSEAYSLIIALIEDLGEEKAKRFFPIKASDIDKKIIAQAKRNKITATQNDMHSINLMTNHNPQKYFKIKKKGTDKYILEPLQILKENVEFYVEDFKNGIEKVEKSNSLIMCRNFWAYMSEDDTMECAKKLHQNLDETSLIIIGGFDLQGSYVPEFLTELNIDCATDYYKEEIFLRNTPDEDIADYEDIEEMRKYITHYSQKKR